MNAVIQLRFARAERLTLLGAAAAFLLSGLLVWHAPQALAPACRFAVFACLGPALGSLLFLLIHQTTGGQWGETLRPFFTAGVRLVPWIWLLVLPMLFFALGPHHSGGSSRRDYFGFAMIMLRACFYALIFFVVARMAKQAASTTSLRWVGPAGLIVIIFTLHLLAQDWIASLQPGWYSTAFPLVWMTGQVVSGVAGATLAATIFGRHPPMEKGSARRPLGLDWGNLMLTATMFWCYVTFAQFLIIWAGNLPGEISWYVSRSHGGWLAVIVMLGVVHFLLPLLVLLSRRAKRSGRMLGGVAGLLLIAQWLFIAWLILPAFSVGWPMAALSLALLGALGGFLLNRYLADARRQLEAE